MNVSLDSTSKFFPVHCRVRKLGFLKSPWLHILSDWEDSFSGTLCFYKRGESNLWYNWQYLWRRNVHINIKKFYITLTAGNTFYLEQTILIHLNFTLLGVFPICSNIFPIIVQCRFFSSGKDPNILMNLLEDYIIFLI